MNRKNSILLGGLLLVCTLFFIINNWNVIFNRNYHEAKTILSYKTNSEVKARAVIEVLPDNFARVESIDGIITIETAQLDFEQVDEVQDVLEKHFKGEIELLRIEHIGESKKTLMFYVVYLMVGISLVISIRLIYLGFRRKHVF